jgi:hypothetical protein
MRLRMIIPEGKENSLGAAAWARSLGRFVASDFVG